MVFLIMHIPLTLNIDLIASASKALAPNPYTVSVGKDTSFPDCINLAHLLMFALLAGTITHLLMINEILHCYIIV